MRALVVLEFFSICVRGVRVRFAPSQSRKLLRVLPVLLKPSYCATQTNRDSFHDFSSPPPIGKRKTVGLLSLFSACFAIDKKSAKVDGNAPIRHPALLGTSAPPGCCGNRGRKVHKAEPSQVWQPSPLLCTRYRSRFAPFSNEKSITSILAVFIRSAIQHGTMPMSGKVCDRPDTLRCKSFVAKKGEGN